MQINNQVEKFYSNCEGILKSLCKHPLTMYYISHYIASQIFPCGAIKPSASRRFMVGTISHFVLESNDPLDCPPSIISRNV